MKIYPVIHFLDAQTALAELDIARTHGADGAFLINHSGDYEPSAMVEVAATYKSSHPDFELGINLLGFSPLDAAQAAMTSGLDMVWADSMGVTSGGLSGLGETMRQIAQEHPELKLFASVAFKYQPADLDPPLAARTAKLAGFIPTTSGDATGVPPDIFKVASMSVASGGTLAIASGMTPQNIAEYTPLLTHVFVATGICKDEHHIDPAKLKAFMAAAREADKASA